MKAQAGNIQKEVIGLPSTMRSYPSYKDSRVEWLGEVPAHWEVRRLKYLLKERDTRSLDGSEQLLRVSQYTGVTQRNLTGDGKEPDTRAESLVGYKCVAPNDLVVNIMLAWNGSLGVSQFPGITSPAYCVYRFNGHVYPWYFHHLLRSSTYKNHIKTVSTGVVESRLRLYTDDLYRLEALLPPLPEQRAIVRFLDHTDRRIQRYIRAKERLIELLEEQKQAIIHQAVTGQIDVRTGQPYPSYKDSGVEWLGKVPEHWDMIPLKRISRCIQNGATPPTAEPEYYENGTVPWYGPSSCGNSENVGHPVKHLNQSAFAHGIARLVRGPAILFVVIGATAGRMALMNEEGSTNQQITSYEIDSDLVDPRFILRHLRQAERWLRSTASSATLPILNSSILNGLKCAVPSLNEQELINRVLDSQIVQTDRSVLSASHQINLLLEYRTRLVADVVTGKIDVREAAVSLPQVDSPEFETGPVGGKEEEAS